jgi:hypothetical protein
MRRKGTIVLVSLAWFYTYGIFYHFVVKVGRAGGCTTFSVAPRWLTYTTLHSLSKLEDNTVHNMHILCVLKVEIVQLNF